MIRKPIFAPLGLALAVTLVSGAVAQEPSSRRAAMASPGVPVTVIEAGKPVPVESLPPDVQAQIARIRAAGESLSGEPDSGAQRFSVTIRCTYPPLKCTITIEL